MEIKVVPSPLVHVASHPDLYLFNAPGLTLVERLVFGLIYDAMHVGNRDLHWQSDGHCHMVMSKTNWLAADGDNEPDPKLFERIAPLPDAGQNSIRQEICVAAFAQHVLLLGSECVVIKGSLAAFPADWLKRVSSGGRRLFGVAFVMPPE
jgi:hypothetical protein